VRKSIPLEALEKALRVYEKKRDIQPTEVVAQDRATKCKQWGCAKLRASLRTGLLEKPEDGKLAVSKDVENYQYAPDQDQK
jgi:hypothetical protein